MMKNSLMLLLFLSPFLALAQPPYYDNVDITLTGQDLYFELQAKINLASTVFTYGEVRDTMKVTDEDPDNTSNVLLIYGYDNSGSCITDRSRDKNFFGGDPCEFNREHVFARSNSDPPMGSVSNSSTGIGADPHNIRSSDVQMNGNRDNKKFADGSGNAGDVGSGNWYPGDEWKGDVARMMMYMYTRYGSRCLPSLNGVGATQGSTDMLQVYLQWNADDPVNAMEDQRNPHLETVYGNRNPFIDNPYLATLIWGGPMAEDHWGLASVSEFDNESVVLYPSPASDIVWIQSTTEIDEMSYSIYDLRGRVVLQNSANMNQPINVSTLINGVYLIEINAANSRITKKIIVNR